MQDWKSSLRDGLCSAYEQITEYERNLVTPLISGLEGIPGVRIWGITDVDALMHRMPTVSFTHERLSTHEIADRLGAMGIFVWSGNHYAVPFTEAVGIEPEGTLRVGLLHYNTQGEVGVLLDALNGLLIDH